MSRNQRRNRRNKQGSSQRANRNATRQHIDGPSAAATHQRSSTETKSSLRTTELLAYAGAVLAVIMTALALDEDGSGGDDPFGAESAIRYITYLTIGYLVARGLAKSGSHENRVVHDSDDDDAVDGSDDGSDGSDDGSDGSDDGSDEEVGNTDTVEALATRPEPSQPTPAESAGARS